MSDTLATIRRALRASQSAERRKLRHKMSPYNSLSQKTRSTADDRDYDLNKAKTTNDVISETLLLARQVRSGRRTPVHKDATDRLLHDCNVISPEVREAWHAKVGMVSLLSAETKAKLAEQSGSAAMLALRNAKQADAELLRESRLDELAKWMVWMWCDEEGYDPGKHPKVTKA